VGGLVERLVADGLDAPGVDPNAPAGRRLVKARVEQLSSIGRTTIVPPRGWPTAIHLFRQAQILVMLR
jgi:hypothetical protein